MTVTEVGANTIFLTCVWEKAKAVWDTITQLALSALQLLRDCLNCWLNSENPAPLTEERMTPAPLELPPPPQELSLSDYYKHLLAALWDILQNPIREGHAASSRQAVLAPVDRGNIARIQEVPIRVLENATAEEQLHQFTTYLNQRGSTFSAALWTSDRGACLYCIDAREQPAHSYVICGSMWATHTEEESGESEVRNILSGENRPGDQPSPWTLRILTIGAT